jgi:hypothetical protein
VPVPAVFQIATVSPWTSVTSPGLQWLQAHWQLEWRTRCPLFAEVPGQGEPGVALAEERSSGGHDLPVGLDRHSLG